MIAHAHRWHCRVNDFARMAEAGIFREDDRIELIRGEICVMSPIGPRHTAIVKRLNTLLSRRTVDRAIVSVQDPIQLADDTQPQPDLALLHVRTDFYAHAHPRANDVYLVVEVAETSLAYDRKVKVACYAEAGIPETWIVDVVNGKVFQYAQPEETAYRTLRVLQRGETLTSVSIPTLCLTVEEILG